MTIKTILVRGVLFEPAHPENLNLLPPGSIGDLPCAFVVDWNCKYVDKSTIPIGMRVIALGGGNHDIRSRADIDNVRTPLEVVCSIIDAQCLVNRYIAVLVDVGVEYVFSCGIVILNEKP